MLSDRPLLLIYALLLDATFGEPAWIWRTFPHPIRLMGGMIELLEKKYNIPSLPGRKRRRNGLIVILGLLGLSAALGFALHFLFRVLPWGGLMEILIVTVLLAQRSLYHHVYAVFEAFATGGLKEARKAVSMIAGRDPESLDQAGVCRTAIESCGENLSDGVIAPAFWYLVLGLPGIIGYKCLNTSDSMIGHYNKRYLEYGFWTARMDDWANYFPARITGYLLTFAGSIMGHKGSTGRHIMHRDGKLHRSPNAGWPEAALAGVMGLALAGPRKYGNITVYDKWMNRYGRKEARPDEIVTAIWICISAGLLFMVALTILDYFKL